MKNAIKTAVSLPAETFRRGEALRRSLRASRSALYAAALEAYFRAQDIREKEERYLAGYRKKPDLPDPWLTAAWMTGLEKEDW